MTSQIEDDKDQVDSEGSTEDLEDADEDVEDADEDVGADQVVVEDLVDENDGEQDEDALIDPKEQAARSLEIRRAIEKRIEEKRLEEDINYLDADLDEE